MSSVVATVFDNLDVHESALDELTHGQGRADLGQQLHDLVSAVVDLKRRVLVLEHPGATQELVSLAVAIDQANLQLAIAQDKYSKLKSPENAAAIAAVQAQISMLKSSAADALAAQPAESSVVTVLRDLLASAQPAPTTPAAPAAPTQQQPADSGQPA